MSEYGEVFGAYTSIGYTTLEDENEIKQRDPEAFLFSLTKKTIHEQYQNFDEAFKQDPKCLLKFGEGIDLKVFENQDKNSYNSCWLGGTYEPIYEHRND